ncbi:MAG TPA: hydroxymethylbilane synthase [Candidatus Aquilonibacter sp.]|nr:hydroxymethylbilane synthase [Candidatus Aquilonibacter sp.]
MSTRTIRIGSRGSELALWQANYVAEGLRARGHDVSVEVIRTTGDRMQDPNFRASKTFEDGSPLDAKGIFIKEIEDTLAAGRIDVAVHSLKDLPTELDSRFTLAAVPPRADARDAFVCEEFWGLHMLPLGARIGTTSPRRKAMLLALRPDLRFVELRGNVDTRLRKWQDGAADALVLAAAGLDRLGRSANVHQRFGVDELCPAPGQGALALEVRCPEHSPEGSTAEAEYARAAVAELNCSSTSFAVAAERAVLHALGGGCSLPLGAFCHLVDETWHLHAMVVSPDGDQVVQVLDRAPHGIPALELGERVAQTLKDRGAMELLNEPMLP